MPDEMNKSHMQKIVSCIVLCILYYSLQAQDTSLFQKKVFIRGKDTLRYRVLFPENYRPGKAYPLLIFLHGSGERGHDNHAQLLHGGSVFTGATFRRQFPVIVLFPQCPSDSSWARYRRLTDSTGKLQISLYPSIQPATSPARLVKLLADSLVQSGTAKREQLYLGGLSMGGFGTYDMLIRYPHYFRAAFSICGGCDPQLYVQHAVDMPLWIFHGAKDNVVNPAFGRNLYAALQKANAPDVHYTEYPEAMHNSWDNAFAEPGLLPWLFGKHPHRKTGR